MQIASYISLNDLKEIELNTERTTDDKVLRRLCLEASRDFELLTEGRLFYPIKQTRYFDHPQDVWNLPLPQSHDLLEILSLTTKNGERTMSSSEYLLMNGKDYNFSPYNRISIIQGSNHFGFEYTSTIQKSTAITGYWGFVEGWSTNSCWVDTGLTISGIDGNSITVSNDVSGVDSLGLSDAISSLDLLKFTVGDETEFVFVTKAINKSLTVSRGVNGGETIDSLGVETPTVYRFRPDDSISKAVRRLASWYYRQKNSSRDMERPIATNTGFILPAKFPADVMAIAKSYSYIY